MHGRIVQYLSTNERGAVINASRILFDFNKDAWHDDRILPVVGMLVEFRCNEKTGRITDCKASKYQTFGKNSLVKERHFWSCESDARLEEIERDLRSEAVLKIYKETDWDSISKVPLTLDMQESIRKYFNNEFLAASFLNDLYLSDDNVVFDYQITKRFLTKTLDTLLFNDKTIHKDLFSNELGMIVRLDRLYTDFDKYKNNNLKQMFEEAFLIYQHHYHALNTAISKAREQRKFAEKKIQFCGTDLMILDRKIQAKSRLQESLEKKQKVLDELKTMSEMQEKSQARELYLKKIKAQFEEYYFEIFCKEYEVIYKKLIRKFKSGLDLCATLLDNKIHKEAVNSQALKNTFFKNYNNDTSPSSLSFMQQYLDHLNKDHLNPNDQILYAYVQKLVRENFRYFLIVSNREQETLDIKFNLLEQGKYLSVKIAEKQIQFFALVQENVYDTIYIDECVAWSTVEKMISDIKDLKVNLHSKIILISKSGELKEIS